MSEQDLSFRAFLTLCLQELKKPKVIPPLARAYLDLIACTVIGTVFLNNTLRSYGLIPFFILVFFGFLRMIYWLWVDGKKRDC